MFKRPSNKPAGLLLIALTALLFTMQTVSADETAGLSRTTLLENAVEFPDKNINTKMIRVIFPPAFKTPEHTHEGPGPRYVVKGTLKVIEGDKTNIYTAGEVFWESGKLMSVENMGQESAELIIFELAPVHKNAN